MILHFYILHGMDLASTDTRSEQRVRVAVCFGFALAGAPCGGDRRRLSLPPKAEVHREYRCRSGRDSDLEAFSHNPSDGSFAPLAYQPST